MTLSPEPAAAGLARAFALERGTIRLMLGRLLPEGTYGVAFVCSKGVAALLVEASGERWHAREVEVAARSSGALARELVESHGCAAAVGIGLPQLRRLLAGDTAPVDFIRDRGESWGVATRSGVEGLLAASGPLAKMLGIEDDLRECDIGVDTVLALLGDYLASAREYACARGVGGEARNARPISSASAKAPR